MDLFAEKKEEPAKNIIAGKPYIYRSAVGIEKPIEITAIGNHRVEGMVGGEKYNISKRRIYDKK